MAKLSYAARKNLPDSAFALPGKRKLPLTNARGDLDRTHVGNAAARLSMMRHRGTVSHADYLRAHRAIARAERKLAMGQAAENPAMGDFLHEHPYLSFFLGLAAINTIGWIAFLGIAAAKGGASGSGAAATYGESAIMPVPEGTSPTVKVGGSLLIIRAGNPVEATSDNAAVLAPAPGVTGGFVAVSTGTATVTSAATGEKTVVTVVVSGTAGVGKASPKPGPRFVPRLLRVA